LNEDIKVGGGDETISDWNHGFDVVDEIDERLWELPADFEWTKIERELSSYSEFVDGLEALEGKSDLLKLFEYNIVVCNAAGEAIGQLEKVEATIFDDYPWRHRHSIQATP
jgi:hypothetical protein